MTVSLKKILAAALALLESFKGRLTDLEQKTDFVIRSTSNTATIAAESTAWIAHGTPPSGAICPCGWYASGWGTGIDVYAVSTSASAVKNMASSSKTITMTIYWLCSK